MSMFLSHGFASRAKRVCISLIISMTSLLVAEAATVIWDFEQSDLAPIRSKNATATMSYFDVDPNTTEPISAATSFGITGRPGTPPNLADGPARYLYHGALPNNGHCGYAIDHTGFRATTDDGRMDTWTMVFDLYVPEASSTKYNGMFNSNSLLEDAAEWYIHPGGRLGDIGLGISASDKRLQYDRWHRLGLVYDRPNGRASYWLDGAKIFETSNVTDHRYSLWASSHAGPDLVFQGDNSSDSATNNYTSGVFFSSMALSDFAYDDTTMQSLGGPSAAGIPLVETTEPSTSLTDFTSPDHLDLEGRFRYAINFGSSDILTVSGVAFVGSQLDIAGYENTMSPGIWRGTAPEFGDGPDTSHLEAILGTVAYHDVNQGEPNSEIRLAVTPGEAYRLQLMFWKAVGPRSFDVRIEGTLVLDEFNPSPLDRDVALLYTHDFVAQDAWLNILFEPGTSPMFGNHHPILNALTLEELEPCGLPGDANGDGVVDGLDAARIAENWGKSNASWTMGDFDDDRFVGPRDAAILATNWGKKYPGEGGSGEAANVPEPLSVVLLVQICLLLMLRWPRHD